MTLQDLGRAACGLVLVAGCAAWSAAAPVTLAFEAEIDILTGLPFDSGLLFEVGDVVSGVFTFDPAEGDGSTVLELTQPRRFSLNINGVVVSTASYEVEVFNDSPITDFPSASLVDSLRLGVVTLLQFMPICCQTSTRQLPSCRLNLLAAADVLDQASLPEAAAIWNAFNLRRQLSVIFRDGKGAVEGFQATVGQFDVVPEPTAVSSLAIALLAAGYRVCRRSRDRGRNGNRSSLQPLVVRGGRAFTTGPVPVSSPAN